eukprot:3235036-Prymnesium_polylepis.1
MMALRRRKNESPVSGLVKKSAMLATVEMNGTMSSATLREQTTPKAYTHVALPLGHVRQGKDAWVRLGSRHPPADGTAGDTR